MAALLPAGISARQLHYSTHRARIVFTFIFSGLDKIQGGGPPRFVAMRRHQTGLHRQLVVRNGYFLSCNGDRLGRHGNGPGFAWPRKRKHHPRPSACRAARTNEKRRPNRPPFVFRRCLNLRLQKLLPATCNPQPEQPHPNQRNASRLRNRKANIAWRVFQTFTGIERLREFPSGGRGIIKAGNDRLVKWIPAVFLRDQGIRECIIANGANRIGAGAGRCIQRLGEE